MTIMLRTVKCDKQRDLQNSVTRARVAEESIAIVVKTVVVVLSLAIVAVLIVAASVLSLLLLSLLAVSACCFVCLSYCCFVLLFVVFACRIGRCASFGRCASVVFVGLSAVAPLREGALGGPSPSTHFCAGARCASGGPFPPPRFWFRFSNG